MKKIYSKPITDCSAGLFPIPVLEFTKSGDDEYHQVIDPNDPETEDDGRANPTNVWDTL